MELASLTSEMNKIESAITAADEHMYGDLLDRLQSQRSALNMVATYLIPRSRADGKRRLQATSFNGWLTM